MESWRRRLGSSETAETRSGKLFEIINTYILRSKFCAGKTDINDASRPILLAEMATCKKNGVRYMEFPIAFDALTIAINPQNDLAKDITVAELKKLWEPAAQGKIIRWNQVRAAWPDRPIKLFGAGDKSGTFDYFNEAMVTIQTANSQAVLELAQSVFLRSLATEDRNS